MKKLVIFDLDGTLLNTIADLAASTNQALQQCGYPTHPVESYRYFVGNGINKLFERALPESARHEKNILRIRSLFIPYYNQHNADLSKPYPGISKLLQTLQQNNIQIAVASNKYQEATSKLVAHFFPEIEFVAVFGQRESVPAKPSPEVIFEIMKKTNIPAQDIVYVGDSNVDMQTGANAGIDTIGVSWGFRPRAELASFQPACLADQAGEIWEFVARSKKSISF